MRYLTRRREPEQAAMTQWKPPAARHAEPLSQPAQPADALQTAQVAPGLLTGQHVGDLQRTLGNRSTQLLLNPTTPEASAPAPRTTHPPAAQSPSPAPQQNQPKTTAETPKPYKEATPLWHQAYQHALALPKSKQAKAFNDFIHARLGVKQRSGQANCIATSKMMLLMSQGLIRNKLQDEQEIASGKRTKPKGSDGRLPWRLLPELHPDLNPTDYRSRVRGPRDAQNFNRIRGSSKMKSRTMKQYEALKEHYEEDNSRVIDRVKPFYDRNSYFFQSLSDRKDAIKMMEKGVIVLGDSAESIMIEDVGEFGYNRGMHVNVFFWNPFDRKFYAEDPYSTGRPAPQYQVKQPYIKGRFEYLHTHEAPELQIDFAPTSPLLLLPPNDRDEDSR